MEIRAFNRQSKTEVAQVHRIQQAAYAIEARILGIAAEKFYPLKETIQQLSASMESVFVVCQGGCVIGAISLEMGEGIILISKLVIDPLYFRRGAGRALIEYSLKAHPNVEFQVGTGALNRPAIRLYESFGFQIFQEEFVEPDLKIVKMKRPIHFPANS